VSNAVVDLRSDTLTTPTEAMRRAMAAAEVGDDVFGEDPTVRALEERCADIMAKEAALFVSSGTQGNLCALLTHCRPRQEVIAEERAHIVTWEVGGWASVAGLSMRTVHAPRGVLTAELIRDAVKPANVHLVDSRLVCVENTHNVAGGTYATPDDMRQIAAAARAHGLRIHVDGARIFNAAAAQDLAVADLVADADSVQFCLSKGLGAPVGSLLVGARDFIDEARRVRKMLGGGMRQVGVIAAAGLVALDEIAPKLPRDHANARLLAELLSDAPGLQIDLDLVQTNIVFWELGHALGTPVEFAARLEERGVRIIGFEGTQRCRAVTYHQVSEESVRLAAGVIHDLAVELAL
jgi:threonine aldolase